VLLCDDAVELRVLLRSELERDRTITIVGETGDGDTALLLARRTAPHVILLDLDMPGPEPADVVLGLRRAAPYTALVTFSGHDPRSVLGDAARHVPKTTELAMIRRAVRSLLERSA